MEYNFTEKEENSFVNNFYQVYFVPMYSRLLKRTCKSITKEEAKQERDKQKKKYKKELKFAKTLISQMLVGCCLKSPYRKHYYEDYDLMLLFMRYLKKDMLDIRDFANLDVKDFYVKCLKDRFDKLDEIKEQQYSLSLSDIEGQNKLYEQEEKLTKNLIPTYEEFEENNGYEL